MNFNFIASDTLDLNRFENVGKFVDDFPDFQTVVINDENELSLGLCLTNQANKAFMLLMLLRSICDKGKSILFLPLLVL